MFTKNICKFITESSDDKLKTHLFIYETDVSVMEREEILAHQRILLVKSGAIVFSIGHAKLSANPGTLIFAFQGESFSATAAEGDSYLYIDFSGSRSHALFRRYGINGGNRLFEGFEGLIPFWQDSLFRALPENIDLAAESMVLHALSRLSLAPTPESALVQKIIDITDETFNNPELSISALSKQLSYNPKYLSHLFKQKMGVGYTEYLRTLRIKYAILLLDHNIDSIKNIAALCGFSNALYFSAVFKQTMGFSPSDYKKTKQNTLP